MSLQETPALLREIAEQCFDSEAITPDRANAMLEAISQNNLSEFQSGYDRPFFTAYLTLLGQRAACKYPAPSCECVNAFSVRYYIRKRYDLPTMARIARHLGHCRECNDFFWLVEQEPK